ncbi:MAG: septum site-determining protein MinC [Desulfitobacteriaceae bacterium]|nr:septum site-determining protein MinC [Desulfitobacteriaceae bacterium]MDI6878687.1 septum site-determining protein MinC [Desulfitobacteriaceae bacterium]MDI6914130.1 septum site-determining protein MinC [Desulfitobacteriaceae bacterium]
MTRTEHLSIKGTRDGLVLYLDPNVEFQIVLDELKHYLGESSQFLQGATVRCYAGERGYNAEELQALTSTLASYNLELSGWLKAAEVYGKTTRPSDVEREKGDESMAEGNCLFIDRTLRSGNSVQYEGHVVVLGDVNPGAEIISTGNIVVLGALRGVAHAGASGNRLATVSAYHLIPTQLRIADLLTRAPDGEDTWRGPEIARVKEGQLIVEGLAGMTWKGSLR